MASAVYALLLTLFLLSAPGHRLEAGFIVGTSVYVFMACLVCGALSFIASIVSKKGLKLVMPKAEAYLFVVPAALLANACSIILLGTFASSLNFVIYAASAISIYGATKIYDRAWRTLERLLEQRQSGVAASND